MLVSPGSQLFVVRSSLQLSSVGILTHKDYKRIKTGIDSDYSFQRLHHSFEGSIGHVGCHVVQRTGLAGVRRVRVSPAPETGLYLGLTRSHSALSRRVIGVGDGRVCPPVPWVRAQGKPGIPRRDEKPLQSSAKMGHGNGKTPCRARKTATRARLPSSWIGLASPQRKRGEETVQITV